jgi:hypothetical protein
MLRIISAADLPAGFLFMGLGHNYLLSIGGTGAVVLFQVPPLVRV